MKLKLEGVPPYDGEYQFDMSRMTNRELHTIKRLSGVTAANIGQALEDGDNDVIVALMIIGVQRSGKFARVDENSVWEADVGRILAMDDDEVDAVPPPSETSTPSTRSGESSPNGSEIQETNPNPTGLHSLDTSASRPRVSAG
jgi:hypothetical protein